MLPAFVGFIGANFCISGFLRRQAQVRSINHPCAWFRAEIPVYTAVVPDAPETVFLAYLVTNLSAAWDMS